MTRRTNDAWMVGDAKGVRFTYWEDHETVHISAWVGDVAARADIGIVVSREEAAMFVAALGQLLSVDTSLGWPKDEKLVVECNASVGGNGLVDS